jgi:uncharacterized OsmC-like protein
MSKLNFSISGNSITATRYDGKARQFSLIVDEPEELGGQDIAPNPVEYLLAAYAGCINVVIHLVANELRVTVSNIKININGDINPERLLGLSKVDRAGFESLTVDIDLETEAPREVIEKLFEQVKDRCPLNDNLSNSTPLVYNIKHLNINHLVN